MAIESKTAYWVAEDGSYGYGEVFTFTDEDLTQDQQNIYDNLDDADKFYYIEAIKNNLSTKEWEQN